MSVTLNGNTYETADFVGASGRGYNETFPATGLTLFPESIFTDMLGELAGGAVMAVDDLTDAVITGTPADNEVLAYDTGTSKWINQTAAEAGLATATGLSAHIADTANPHSVTKAQVGLTNVEDTALSTWVGSANITTLGTIASLVATTADINGGTIDGTAIGGSTPAAGAFTSGAFSTTLGVTGVLTAQTKNVLTRDVVLNITEATTDCSTDDGQIYFTVGPVLAGMNLSAVHARNVTAGTTGTMDVQVHNVTSAADMLSTVITIDSTETGSDTAATPAVIDTGEDDVAEHDLLRIDVDAVHTTAAKGLIVRLTFVMP